MKLAQGCLPFLRSRRIEIEFFSKQRLRKLWPMQEQRSFLVDSVVYVDLCFMFVLLAFHSFLLANIHRLSIDLGKQRLKCVPTTTICILNLRWCHSSSCSHLLRDRNLWNVTGKPETHTSVLRCLVSVHSLWEDGEAFWAVPVVCSLASRHSLTLNRSAHPKNGI